MDRFEQALLWATALVGDEVYVPETWACVRWKRGEDRMRQQLLPVADVPAIAARIVEVGEHADTYMGVCPRARQDGGGDAVRRTHALWADCDSDAALDALGRFEHPPSMVVQTSPGRRHAYWIARRPLDAGGGSIERANRRLAHALGADARVVDRARIMRAPGTTSFKRDPFPVELLDVYPEVYDVEQLVGGLPDPELERRPAPRARLTDALDSLPASVYVPLLSGHDVGRDGKTLCPFHEERTPSLHAYDDPERGWCCFGCQRGGRIVDFGAHLFELEPRGREYHEIRRLLAQRLLGVAS